MLVIILLIFIIIEEITIGIRSSMLVNILYIYIFIYFYTQQHTTKANQVGVSIINTAMT